MEAYHKKVIQIMNKYRYGAYYEPNEERMKNEITWMSMRRENDYEQLMNLKKEFPGENIKVYIDEYFMYVTAKFWKLLWDIK